MMEQNKVKIAKEQLVFGAIVHWITIISCILALIAPVIIILSKDNLIDSGTVFTLIFEKSATAKEVWNGQFTSWWSMMFDRLFTGEGMAMFSISLGCSVSFWALLPTIYIFFKKKNYLYVGITTFVSLLILLAMSNLIKMAA